MTTIPKRDRLIEAAKTLFYQQGVTGTTLANIAERAKVPLGNVYYHFRTKDALIEAVVQAHVQELQSLWHDGSIGPIRVSVCSHCWRLREMKSTCWHAMAVPTAASVRSSTRMRVNWPTWLPRSFRSTWTGRKHNSSCSARLNRRPEIWPLT